MSIADQSGLPPSCPDTVVEGAETLEDIARAAPSAPTEKVVLPGSAVPARPDYDHLLWMVLGTGALAVSAAYVYFVNKDVGPQEGTTLLEWLHSPQAFATVFRLASAYLFNRYGTPFIEYEVNRRFPDSRAGRVTEVIAFNGGANFVDGAVYGFAGAHPLSSTVPFMILGSGFQIFHIESCHAGKGGLTGLFDTAKEWVEGKYAFLNAWSKVFVRQPIRELYAARDVDKI